MSDTENEKKLTLVEVSSADKDIEAVNSGTKSSDMDAGAKYLLDHPQHADYTEEEAKKVLRKIDWMLMPIMTIIITLAAADKILISNAAAYGMTAALKLHGSQYSWLGSIFYFGYLVAETPANFLLQKLPVAKVLIAASTLWNIVLMCMGAANTFPQMAALRFLLGIFETPLFPFCSIITAMFYKKSTEIGIRTSIWFSGFSSVITGTLSYAIGHADVKIENWRLLFIVFASITLFFTAIAFFILPDSPMTCWWLNEREKYIAIHRTIENRTGIKNTSFKKNQALEAVTDLRTWIMCVGVFCANISNGALVTFAAQIVSGLGFAPIITTALGIPTGLMMTLSSWIIAFSQFFFPGKYRTYFAVVVSLVPIICCSLMLTLEGRWSLYVAYLFFYFYWGVYTSFTSLSIANTAGSTKKTTVNAINFTSYCVANIVAPQLFLTKEAPTYLTGYHSILGFSSAATVCLALYGGLAVYTNKKRDNEFGPADENIDDELDKLDLTDGEKKKWFRYVW